jgi:histidinol dehydrogenase
MKIFNLTKTTDFLDCDLTKKNPFIDFIQKSKKENNKTINDVKKIISDIKKDGDKALIKYCNKFDGTTYNKANDFIVSKVDFDISEKTLNQDIKNALKEAYNRIKDYHQKQLPKNFLYKDKLGTKLGNSWRPIESIGIYVPAGTASYPSSVLMSAVPAIVSGVKKIIICTPSSCKSINPAIIYAARLCNINTIYKVGGSQAIASMAYGTKTIKKVDKIVGPGNSYVACAKKILFGEVGIDMIAGPTDITIIADKKNNPNWIGADALSQLEHGFDSKAFIITDDLIFAQKILQSINLLKEKLPRKKIIDQSLKNSAIFVINNINKSYEIANFIAPEHLEIATKNYQSIAKKINNAGAIFLGNYTPEAIGDYIAGPSHTLPTLGSSKFSSGLSVYDFLKRISIISCNKESFLSLAKSTEILAECEGFQAHKLSITIRKNDLQTL